MDKRASAGISGFLGIVVCIALYLLLRRFFPGLSVVFLVILGLAALVTVGDYVLGLQIDNYGGLSNLGKKSMLSSIQSMLPFAQSLLSLCLEIGYLAAMLRIARGMYTSPQTLRLGFDRFWLLMRCTVFKGLIMTGVLFSCLYFGMMIYMVTPFSDAAVAGS